MSTAAISIDELARVYLSPAGPPPGFTSARMKAFAKKYLRAHPGFTVDGHYSDAVYQTANRLYAIAEGLGRAEKSRRRMRRQGLL